MIHDLELFEVMKNDARTQYIKNKVRKEIAVTIWQRNSFRILPFHAVLTLDYFLLNIVKQQ